MGRKNSESGNSQAEHRLLAAMVESASDAIIGLDPDGTIVTWNSSAVKLLGYSSKEAIHNHISLILPPDRHHEIDRFLGEARAGRSVDQFETSRKRKDGSLVDVSISVSPILNETGNVIGVAAFLRDITRRKRAEKALQASEERFTRAFMGELPSSSGCGNRQVAVPTWYAPWKAGALYATLKEDFERRMASSGCFSLLLISLNPAASNACFSHQPTLRTASLQKSKSACFR